MTDSVLPTAVRRVVCGMCRSYVRTEKHACDISEPDWEREKGRKLEERLCYSLQPIPTGPSPPSTRHQFSHNGFSPEKSVGQLFLEVLNILLCLKCCCIMHTIWSHVCVTFNIQQVFNRPIFFYIPYFSYLDLKTSAAVIKRYLARVCVCFGSTYRQFRCP